MDEDVTVNRSDSLGYYAYKNESRQGRRTVYDIADLVSIHKYLKSLTLLDTADGKDKLIVQSPAGNSDYDGKKALKFIHMAVCDLAPMIQIRAVELIEEEMRKEADNLVGVAGTLLSDACCRQMTNNLKEED
jgi:hypothetical protein